MNNFLHIFIDRFKVGLMHGRLHADEKDEVMRAFSEGEIHVLVSTTVVEVGVNVPNATFMVIYDAERFGLSAASSIARSRWSWRTSILLYVTCRSENR